MSFTLKRPAQVKILNLRHSLQPETQTFSAFDQSHRQSSSTNPNEFIDQYNTKDKIQELLLRHIFNFESVVSKIKFQEWGWIQDESDGNIKTRNKLLDSKVAQCIEDFLKKYGCQEVLWSTKASFMSA